MWKYTPINNTINTNRIFAFWYSTECLMFPKNEIGNLNLNTLKTFEVGNYLFLPAGYIIRALSDGKQCRRPSPSIRYWFYSRIICDDGTQGNKISVNIISQNTVNIRQIIIPFPTGRLDSRSKNCLLWNSVCTHTNECLAKIHKSIINCNQFHLMRTILDDMGQSWIDGSYFSAYLANITQIKC